MATAFQRAAGWGGQHRSRALVALCLFACVISACRAAEITLTQPGGQPNLSWPSASPAWRLQYATNLAAPNWMELTNFTVTNATYTVVEPPSDACRFYRLCQHPVSEEQPPVPIATDQDGDTLSTNLNFPTPLEGSLPAFFDASQSTDPRGGTLDYHWLVYTPQGVHVTDQGMTGYHSSVLNMQPNSLPSSGISAFLLRLTLTHEPFDPYATTPQATTVDYYFQYLGSIVSLPQFTTCQSYTNIGPQCPFQSALHTLETP